MPILRWSCWSGGTITTALRLWLSWVLSRRQPGANPAGCDRDAASPGNGANRFRRARALFAAGGGSGARRRDCDAASPGGPGANLCLRRDPDALAVGAAPLRCALPAVARLRGQREAEAAGSVVDSDFSSLFQPRMSPIDRHRRVSDVIDGRCTLHARLMRDGAWEFTSCGVH